MIDTSSDSDSWVDNSKSPYSTTIFKVQNNSETFRSPQAIGNFNPKIKANTSPIKYLLTKDIKEVKIEDFNPV